MPFDYKKYLEENDYDGRLEPTKDQLYQSFRDSGFKPEDIASAEDRAAYEAWLAAHPKTEAK